MRLVSADNHILWLYRYSLHLADLTNRSQFDEVSAWGHKSLGAAVMSLPVWKCYDVLWNNNKFAICSDVRADLRITARVCGALRIHRHRPAAACFWSGSLRYLAKNSLLWVVTAWRTEQNLVGAIRVKDKMMRWSVAAFKLYFYL